MADDGQIVVERLHVRIELLLDVAGQKAQVPIAQRHDRPGEQNLPIPLPAFQSRRERQQRFSRARRPRQRYQLDVVVEQSLECEALLRIAGRDAVRRGSFPRGQKHAPPPGTSPAPICCRCGE